MIICTPGYDCLVENIGGFVSFLFEKGCFVEFLFIYFIILLMIILYLIFGGDD